MSPTAIYYITSLPVVGELLQTIPHREYRRTGCAYTVCDLTVSGETLIILRSGAAAKNQVLFYEMIYEEVSKIV